MSFSRVLIINVQSLYENNATGITLRSMFNKWPNDSILEVCLSGPKERAKTDNIRIPSLVMPPSTQPINWLCRRTLGIWIAPRLNQSIINDQRQGYDCSADTKQVFKEIIKGILDASPLFQNNNILHAVDEFKPDVVYTMGGGIAPLKMAYFFSNRYNCNIVLHFMDNWRDTHYKSSFFLKPIRKIFDHYLYRVEQRMKFGLGISEMMVREYSMRSHRVYKAMMNSVKSTLIKSPMLTNNESVVITYTGGMHLNRWKILIEVELCIAKLREKGMLTRLQIYTTDQDREKYEDMFNPNVTEFKKFLPHYEVYRAYEQSDILLHIESSDPKIMEFTKYSLSTKIPEYMSSGKPILCFAPSNLAVYEYINNSGAGVAVSDREGFLYWAEKFIQFPELRLSYAKKGIDTVLQVHTEEVIYNMLREILT